jgi:hypothetical protein
MLTKEKLMIRLSEELIFQFDEFYQLDQSLINDKQIAIKILNSNNLLFEFFPYFFRDDEEVAYAAIQRNGYPFRFASERLKNDRLFILEATKNGIGENFQYLNEIFKNDIEIASLALNFDPYGVFGFIGDSLKNNFEFMLLAISRCGDIAAYECSQELLLNINFVYKAIKIYPDSYMPIAKSENPLSINKDVILLTLNEMHVYEHYRTEYLYDAIYNTIKNEAINDNEINELLIKVKKSM